MVRFLPAKLLLNKSLLLAQGIPLLIAGLFLFSCNGAPENKPVRGDWIKGTEQEQIRTIEKQFRGMDNAMVETGYRYQELYWAGRDGNWDYAAYQLDKIKLAVELGLERRPKRAPSAGPFLSSVLPEMRSAIESKDSVLFNQGFRVLTNSCNSCHEMEKVSFFRIKEPVGRISPVSQ